MANQVDSLALKDNAYLIERLDELIHEKTHPNAMLYVQAYIRNAKKQNDKLNLFYAYKEGVFFSSHLNTQIEYADSAIITARKLKNKDLIATALLSKGLAYYKAKYYRDALQNYLNADQELKYSKDQYLLHKVTFNMAMIKIKLHQYNQAEELLLKCKNFFQTKPENKDYQAYLLNSIYQLACLHQEVGNKAKAKEFNQLGLNKSKLDNNEYFLRYFTINKAIDEFLNDQFETAIHILSTKEDILIKTNDFNTLTKIYYYKAKGFDKLNNQQHKIIYFNKIDSIFNKFNFLEIKYRPIYENILDEALAASDTSRQLYIVNQLLKMDELNYKLDAEMIQVVYKEYDTVQLLKLKEKILNKSQKLYYVLATSFTGIIVLIVGIVKTRNKNKRLIEKFNLFIEESAQSSYTERRLSIKDEEDLNKEAFESLLLKFEEFEQNKEFLNPNITVVSLAKSFSTNTTYLSKCVNQYKGINFSSYINRLRIKFITDLLQEQPQYHNYSVGALGEIAGYMNPRQFSNVFYSETGLRPLDFIKIQKQKNKEST
ncbi:MULTISPECIES: helix-turn-helix domain-containing protein [unclassified Empedobacter]|uniref:helix-turn-helix domain-containing protein n=1 Tax=unclassified Empedobacter TaxID=2643773 RepID=UPI0025C59237|nr:MULTISPECIES: helix-turn-helix domain-containing protein [unclassified Empedobacter]